MEKENDGVIVYGSVTRYGPRTGRVKTLEPGVPLFLKRCSTVSSFVCRFYTENDQMKKAARNYARTC